MVAEYLKITIHDNDFTGTYKIIGKTLLSMFRYYNYYPTKNNVDQLKYAIRDLWFSIYQISRSIDNQLPAVSRDYFVPDVEIVDYLDMPKCSNAEDIYIPLFPLFDSSDEILLV